MHFPFARLSEFAGDILVRCPRCEGRAHLLRLSNEQESCRGQRLVCPACGTSREWLQGSGHGGIGIPFPGGGPDLRGFDLKLWLQTACCGEVLWAYNRDHIDFLATYVEAGLRGRRPDPKWGWSNQSLQSRLPRWMLDRHRRADVLAGLERLRGQCGG